jgi:hypothetical protein
LAHEKGKKQTLEEGDSMRQTQNNEEGREEDTKNLEFLEELFQKNLLKTAQ